MDAPTQSTGWEQLYSLQQEYESICRTAWSLRTETDAKRRAELDREVSAVMHRVNEVFCRQRVPGLFQ
jgi:hypothetical protein